MIMTEDPVVKEVRRVREKMNKLCEGNPHKLGDMIRAFEEKYKHRLIHSENVKLRRTA